MHAFNENYIMDDATKVVCWYLICSFYPTEPYYNTTMINASFPWSGHYTVNPALWAYAHYGQFAKAGWHYLNGACEHLLGGGSLVTLASGSDYSLIAETKDATENQTIIFHVNGGLSQGKLCVWRSNATEQFIRLHDIAPTNGMFSVTLQPDSIYSISTTRGQHKGTFADVPPPKPFPFPYYETFDHYTHPKWWGYLPCYTADICGGFEIAERPDGTGKCLRQVISQKAQSWAPEWMPYTIIGNPAWTNYEVSADIYLDDGGWAGVMGRISSTGSGYGCNPKGYYLRLCADGQCALWRAAQTKNGAPGVQLAAGGMDGFNSNQWHNVELQFVGSTINGLIDHKKVLTAKDGTYDKGMAGLVTGGENDARSTALFDNLIINPVNGDTPKPTRFPQDSYPMYKP